MPHYDRLNFTNCVITAVSCEYNVEAITLGGEPVFCRMTVKGFYNEKHTFVRVIDFNAEQQADMKECFVKLSERCTIKAASDAAFVERKKSFREKLASLINEHNLEGGSDTPDFILAQFLANSLANFEAVTKRRDAWHGFVTFASNKTGVSEAEDQVDTETQRG